MTSQMDIQALVDEAMTAIESCTQAHELNLLKSRYTGKQSCLNSVLRGLKDMEPDERAALSQAANHAKKQIFSAIQARHEAIKDEVIRARLRAQTCDVTLPGRSATMGALHPLTQTIEEISDILARMGFQPVDGPEVEDDYHNFTALNLPEHHPARAMHDTFYLDGQHLLRTHTSSVQIRALERFKKPISVFSVGRTYRCDSDQTHSPMFHQVEALTLGPHISMAMLKGCLRRFLHEFFGCDFQMRLRPSYFPFTEPSAEVDIRFASDEPWLEVLGCGMVHPNVLDAVDLDSKRYRGFALGCGIERLTMLKQRVHDLRAFFVNDLHFLEQFGPKRHQTQAPCQSTIPDRT